MLNRNKEGVKLDQTEWPMPCGVIKVCLDFLEINQRVMVRHICTPEMYLSITGAQM